MSARASRSIQPLPRRSRARGFTLVELVVAIIIVAVLAAMAIGFYVQLQYDSKIAGLKAARGSFRAAAHLGAGKFYLARGNASVADQFIDIDGQNVRFHYGFPAGTADGIMLLVKFDGYTGTNGGAGWSCGAGCWGVSYASASNWCNAHYISASGPGGQPSFNLNTATC